MLSSRTLGAALAKSRYKFAYVRVAPCRIENKIHGTILGILK